MGRSKLAALYAISIAAWALAFVLALNVGSVQDVDWSVISQLRLPRAIAATVIGMGLAVSGAALQALFANPLCEPYTLGISSGSALGAVLGAALGIEWSYGGLFAPAFVGALLFAGALYLISLRSRAGNTTLLLAGVMLGFLGSSLVALCMALTDSGGIQGALFWLLGDLSRVRMNGAAFSAGAALILAGAIWSRWRELDALLMGEEGALALGVPVARTRRRLIILTSLLIGLCVSGGGMIGFVGLVIPHFVRQFVGSLHLRLLPLCAIWGATALTVSDALARTMAKPYELPVGVVTALVGAPLFLWIMLKRGRSA